MMRLPWVSSLLTLFFTLISCGFFTKDSNSQNTMDEYKQEAKEEQQEGYVVQPNYEHPKFKELEALFEEEEHRFEINRCEFKYNDKSFFIGDSYDKIIEIFGKPREELRYTFDKKKYIIQYEKFKLILSFFPVDNALESLTMYMNDHKSYKDTSYKVIKIRNVPYHLSMNLNEFMELSNLEHGENLIHDISAFYIKDEKKCSNVQASIGVGSTPSYNSNDLGGHMTTRGSFNPDSSGPINSLGVSLKNNN